MVLHRTSYGLSSFVANTFKTYEQIEVYISAINRMTVKEQKPLIVRDDQQEEENPMRIEEYDGIPELLSALKSILEIKNVKIGKLIIQHGSLNGEQGSELSVGIQSILDKLNKPLYVEEIRAPYDTTSMDTFLSLVSRIRVGPLVHWMINGTTRGWSLISCDKLIQSPHWNNLKRLMLYGMDTNLKLSQIVHIPVVAFTIRDTSMDEILSYRNKLRQNPNDCNHKITLHNLNRWGIFHALKPFTPDTSNKLGGSYLCDDGKRLYFDMRSFRFWKK